jgi:K+-sensing histidine kinase KdpD
MWPKVGVGAVVTVGVAAAWIPLRDHVPNTDLALVLVIVVAAIGWLAGATSSVVSSVAAAAAFDILDTRPYGALTIARGSDVTTASMLLLTGLLVGAGAARLARYRNSDDHRADALAVVMEASGLVATGEGHRLVTEALSTELVQVLELTDCCFHAAQPTGKHPSVARDGSLVGLRPDTLREVDLPVRSRGDVVGHYRLILGTKRPSRQELRVALSLADQAGAAMANADHETPPPSRPPRKLRLLLSNRAT